MSGQIAGVKVKIALVFIVTFAAALLLTAKPTLAMGGDAECVANKARTVS